MKKRFLTILCILLGLEVIASTGYYFHDLGVDNDFKPYVAEYNYLYSSICKDASTRRNYILSVRYSNDNESDGTIGYCRFLVLKNTVRFDENWWNSANSLQRKQLVYHELTHCYLGITHSFDSSNYMYPFIHNMRDDILVEQTKETLDRICNHEI